MKRALLLALAVLCSCHPEVRSDATPRALAGPFDASHSRPDEWARQLADSVGPRMTGTPGDRRAVEWALAKMTELGLENVHAEKVVAHQWVRGVETGELLQPTEQPLALTALGGSVGTEAGGVQADVAEFPSLDALKASAPDSAAGRIAFINQPMERTRTGEAYGRAVGPRFTGAGEAARHGAVALLIRSVTPSNARFPHTGAMRYPEDVKKIPAAALAVPDAELVHRLGAAGPVRLRLLLGCHPGGDVETANVIGDVVGREHPEQIVLLGAHLDSWDLGTGALDDGAGVGVVLEAGRLLAALRPHPRRTVRVVLFANEENGLAGGRGYAEAHQAELAQHVLAGESDVGTGRPYGLSYRAGPGTDALFASLAAPLVRAGFQVTRGGESGADISPLRAAGVPVIDVQQDASSYFDYHHTANDTADKLDAPSLAEVTAAVATVAQGAAESSADFGRIPADEREHH